ncbi:YuzD family protein [Calditerricola yamamurae]|nr:disulfide oxidoreductase [Bacillota bacterium]
MSVEVTVYGADVRCPSCVNAPSSKETVEWLQAVLGRKFGVERVAVRYVDIYAPQTPADAEWARRVLDDEFFYPLVVIGGEAVAEGVVELKPVLDKLAALGLSESDPSGG